MKKGCDCLDKLRAPLAEHNTRIDGAVDISMGIVSVVIRTAKIDRASRRKALCLGAKFCPFCGKRYPRLALARMGAAKKGGGA